MTQRLCMVLALLCWGGFADGLRQARVAPVRPQPRGHAGLIGDDKAGNAALR